MNFIKRRLQYYLGIIVVISIALPALVTGAIVTRQNYERSVDFEARIRAQNYADVLQGGLSLALWNISPELAKPIMDSIQLDESVLAIYVSSSDGEPFINYHRWPVEIIENEKEKISISTPVFYLGQEIGQFTLHYGLSKSLSRAKEEAVTLIQMLLFQIFITFIVLNLVLNQKVLKPLKKLGAAAKGIASGDLRTQIPFTGEDEFGQLSSQLEAMRRSLEKHVTLLELRVDQRTRDQQKLNDALQESVVQVKQAQKQLVQQEKLAALGGLVAGIAHELNTPVGNALTVSTSLLSSTEAIQQKMAGGMTRSALESYIGDVAEGAEMIEHNLTRAAELVAGFKQTAIDQTTAKRRQFDLHKLITETILTLTPNLKSKQYHIVTDIKPGIVLDSYPGPLSQIVTNLVNNAVLHGFEGRETGEVKISCEQCQVAGKAGVKLRLRDDGRGISADNQKKIFDPFFTTKLGKGGSGLGMHIVHNLVTGALGGDISLVSEEGVGTEFIISIPCVAPVLQHVDGSF
ncbi:MAG TPA: HAMP domain-containing sensor histidine kinase [Marinagarivorans sp.]